MPRTSITLAGLLGAALFASYTLLPVELELRTNTAEARDSRVFWTDGESGQAGARPDSFADMAETLAPAIVNIQIERTAKEGARSGSPDELLEEFFGRGRKRPRRAFPTQSSGSGFVISDDGYIVTNNHVIEDADEINVVFNDGSELPGVVVGTDPKTDLALIKVSSEEKMTVAPLGDSKQVRVGEWVMAIGNPFGLDHTVTVGILSAKGRSGFAGQRIAGPYDDFLQTDAAINPGNSGGPLIDNRGRVIGINTAIAATGQGIGFAIPINMARDLLPQLRETGSVTRGWLGVQIQRVDPKLAESFGLDRPEGALISQVFPNSPAEKAKLEQGDVIVEFGGERISDYDDLPRRVAATPPGSEVDVIVLRDGSRQQLTAVLEKMEDEPTIVPASHELPGSDWGFQADNLNPTIAQQLGLSEDTNGVVVTDVDPSGPAYEAGLREGDVIRECNRNDVTNVEDLEESLESDDARALLLLQRGDGRLFLPITRED